MGNSGSGGDYDSGDDYNSENNYKPDVQKETWEGYSGAACTKSDIDKAIRAENARDDDSGWANQVMGSVYSSSDVRYECAPEHIAPKNSAADANE